MGTETWKFAAESINVEAGSGKITIDKVMQIGLRPTEYSFSSSIKFVGLVNSWFTNTFLLYKHCSHPEEN